MNHQSLNEEKGFIFKNGTFERFEPIGITWNDTYCRRMTDTGPSGCFVERDLSASVDFNSHENNCTGIDTTNLLQVVGLLQASFLPILIRKFKNTLNLKKDSYSCYGFEWKQCEDSPLDILDESKCPIIEEQAPIKSNPVRIELDDSLLDRFNELSEDELRDSFGTFTPVQSLNPYMTKVSICSVEQAWLALFI